MVKHRNLTVTLCLESLYSFKRKGFILITTLLIVLVISLLLLNLLASQATQHKVQENYLNKQFSREEAENNLVLAENSLKEGAPNDSAFYHWQIWQPCLQGKCYLITAKGDVASALTVLQEIYVLESLPVKGVKAYRMGWWELTAT